MVIAYGTVLQIGKYCLTYEFTLRSETRRLYVPITLDNYPAGFSLPFMPRIIEIYNRAHEQSIRRAVATPQLEHKNFWKELLSQYQPYEAIIGKEIMFKGAGMRVGTIGVIGYYLPEVRILDTAGLTDKYISRQPVLTPNRQRAMAHDRTGTESPGFQITLFIEAAVKSTEDALQITPYSLEIDKDLHMPFYVNLLEWAQDNLRGKVTRLERRLGVFTMGDDGWTTEGEAFEGNPVPEPLSARGVEGQVGPYLDSFSPTLGDAPTGLVRSPEFPVIAGTTLNFVVGGGSEPTVGVRLIVDDQIVQVWNGKNTEVLEPVVFDLSPYVGKIARIEVYDDSTQSWGHIMADQFIVLDPPD